MKYGNYLLGLLWILLTVNEPGRIVIKAGGIVPHLLFRTKSGVFHHYRLVRDIFPSPFCYFVFEGQFHQYTGQ